MSNIKGPAFGYVDLLDHATTQSSIKEQEQIKNKEVQFKILRPSSSGKCSRQLAYALLEATDQIPYVEKEIRAPNVTRLLSIGHAVETHFIEQFKKHASEFMTVSDEQQNVTGFQITSTRFPELNIPVSGSLDWVFITSDGKGIIDCKSKKDKFHSYFSSDWKATTDKLIQMQSVEQIADSDQAFWIKDLQAFIAELDDPFFASNFYQLNFYCNTDWAKEQGIDHGAIIQYSKNTSDIRELRFAPCIKSYEETRVRFQDAVNATDSGNVELAPKTFNYGSIACAFCEYKKECWKEKDKDALQAFFDMNYHKKRWPTDIQKIDGAGIDVIKELEGHYKVIQEADALSKEREKAEGAIVTFMLDKGLKKIRFRDKKVYELKFLKSARNNWQIRRSKV